MPETHKVFKKVPLTQEQSFELWKTSVASAITDVRKALETLEVVIQFPLPSYEFEVVEVGPNDPDYGNETLESKMAWDGKLMAESIAKLPSPFLSLVQNGEFPKNTGETKRTVA